MYLSLHSTTTNNLVDKYEQQLQHFMAGTTVCQFKALFPESATPSKFSNGKIHVKLKLLNKWGYDTLNELTDLVGLFGTHLHLTKVERGCFAVTWLCSASDVNDIRKSIAESFEIFRQKGVLQAFVGEDLVLDFRQSGTHCFVHYMFI